MSLKVILSVLCLPFCSADWKRLCNLSRLHYDKNFCEIILNLDKWLFTFFLIFSSDGRFIQQSRTVCPVLIAGIMKKLSVKLF